jgi:hypothetical protein
MFRKLDLFPSSGEGRRHTLLDPLERANLNPQSLDLVVFRIPDNGQSQEIQ